MIAVCLIYLSSFLSVTQKIVYAFTYMFDACKSHWNFKKLDQIWLTTAVLQC